jgi:hypothetical protein
MAANPEIDTPAIQEKSEPGYLDQEARLIRAE